MWRWKCPRVGIEKGPNRLLIPNTVTLELTVNRLGGNYVMVSYGCRDCCTVLTKHFHNRSVCLRGAKLVQLNICLLYFSVNYVITCHTYLN